MFPRTLSQLAQNTLALLGKQEFIRQTYLAGGSSLALQLGHRKSIDFDFFTEKELDLKKVKKLMQSIGVYKSESETPKTLVGEFNRIKFSLFHYPYKLIDETNQFGGINLANIRDIAAMKLAAITDRGTKKDYIDLYFLAKNKFSFEKMFVFYNKKYHIFESNKLTLLKALQYFEDADNSDMPEMIAKTSWAEVKKFLQKEVVRLANKYI